MVWTSFDCSSTTRRWRELDNGKIEVEGLGTPVRAWPEKVNSWSNIIEDKAAKYNVPASWIAAIMAIESGGETNVCYKIGGQCSTADGAGLMAVLSYTANGLIGRPVGPHEMMSDPDLAVDLGTMLIRRLIDRDGEDFLKVAIGYNAGSVKCSYGSSGTTVKDGYGEKESCPQTPWGVRMGCVRTSKAINQYCGSSSVKPGYYNCPVDYPGNAVKSLNAAVDAGWTPYGFGIGGTAKHISSSAFPFIIGGAMGFAAIYYVLPS